MSKNYGHLSLVIDDVLSKARADKERKHAEIHAVKVAEEMPRTDIGKALKALASEIRTASDYEISYGDIDISGAS